MRKAAVFIMLSCIIMIFTESTARALDSERVPIAIFNGYNYSILSGNGDLLIWGDSGASSLDDAEPVMSNVYSIVPGSLICTMVIDENKTLWELDSRPNIDSRQHKKIYDQVASAYCGLNHYLFVQENGTLYVGGRNDAGQLGIGTTDMLLHEPTKLLEDIVSIATNEYNCSYAVREDGTLLFWGTYNERVTTTEPQKIGEGVIRLFTDEYVLLNDNTLCRIVYNEHLNEFELDPILDCVRYATSDLAIREDGTLWGWGDNLPMTITGEVLTTPTHGVVEAPIILMKNIHYVCAGAFYTLVITEEGELWELPNTELLDNENGLNHKPHLLMENVPRAMIPNEYSNIPKHHDKDYFDTKQPDRQDSFETSSSSKSIPIPQAKINTAKVFLFCVVLYLVILHFKKRPKG